MKCPNCGVEIANDSLFCENCGTKIKSSKKTLKLWLWIAAVVVCVAVAAFFFMRGGEDGGVVGGSDSDFAQMNIKGSVKAINETTYYTNPSTGEEVNTSDRSGIFDGSVIGGWVYSNGHIAGNFYKKWFLSQVSNCEIKFNEYGNITSIRSYNPEGGKVSYRYDEHQRVVEMDARSEAGNQDKGRILYDYEVKDGLVVSEHQTQLTGYSPWEMDVQYSYEKNSLSKAVYTSKRDTKYFEYKNNQLKRIRFQDYWGKGNDAVFEYSYNSNGDISHISATGENGRSENARETTFEYKYDSHNNWVERRGTISVASGMVIYIRTVRVYTY